MSGQNSLCATLHGVHPVVSLCTEAGSLFVVLLDHSNDLCVTFTIEARDIVDYTRTQDKEEAV